MEFINAEDSDASFSNGELKVLQRAAVLFVHDDGGREKTINIPDCASLKMFCIYRDGAEARNLFKIGRNCMVEITELFEGGADVQNVIPLVWENCRVRLAAKGVVAAGKSASYSVLASAGPAAKGGGIDVEEHAYLIGNGARATLVPGLECANNLLVARHASSIREIGWEQLFYLMSRGLSESEARGEIVRAFISREAKEIKNLFGYEVKI